ncbi:MAG: hypothetical protein AMXMBFR4_34970 [Candidatus Hydrogenedentota bacterium]
MLSRVADSVFWMSRYIERAENVARYVDVNYHLHLDLPGANGEQWEPMVRITGDYASFVERYDAPTRENVTRFLAFDENNPNSILSCLRMARENARTIREIIPSEIWEHVNTIYHWVREASTRRDLMGSPHEFFTQVKMASHLFVGLTVTCMPHGEPWHFCRLGRLLERADKTSRILDVKYFMLLPSVSDVGSAMDSIQWSALLRSASAFEAYRKRYGRVDPDRVAEFLLFDREFPRAVLYCIYRAEDSLHAISHSPEDSYSNPAEQRCGRLLAELAYADINSVITGGLHEYLDNLQVRLNVLGNAIFETYFALRPVSPNRPA